MTSTLTHDAIVRRQFPAMAACDLDALTEIVHPEATNREASAEPPATRGRGPAAFYATALWLRDAYSDLSFDIHDVVVDGDLAVAHVTMRGRHTGPFVTYDADGKVERAFAPTGREFAVTQTHWIRIADGMAVEHWANRDDMGQAVQLGWIPPTPGYLFRCARATRRARRAHH